jgi:DNA-binding transcriptional regulator LsrR (DeoR family)
MTAQERNNEIVRMYVEDGLTYAAIAERLGVPLGTVSSYVSVARRRGDVPYRRPTLAGTGFGRKREEVASHGGAVTAASILRDVRSRIGALEAELAQLKAVEHALEGR